MSVEPFDWNVVIVGYWNMAILTPAGIASRLFQVEEGTNLRVQVSLDVLAPHKVQSPDGVTVIPDSKSLIIEPRDTSFKCMESAIETAKRALEKLPETPVLAAGINLRFKVTDASTELTEAIRVGLDDRISDCEFSIRDRTLRRSVDFDTGVLNLGLDSDDDGHMVVLLNFEMRSKDSKSLVAWLDMPIAKIRQTTYQVLKDVFSIPWEESSDDH